MEDGMNLNMETIYTYYRNAGIPENRIAEVFADDLNQPLPCFDLHKVFRAIRAGRGGIEDRPDIVRESFLRKQRLANLPVRYQACTWGDLEKRGMPADIQANYEVIKNYAIHFKDAQKTGSGLVLAGNVGRMKTTLAAAVCNQLLWAGFSVFFVPMAELLQMMLSYGKRQSGIELDNLQRRVRDVDLLILDDVGAEYKNDWVIQSFDAMVSNRYNNLKPILITTNLSMTGIGKLYQMRIFDRLKQCNLLLSFDGKSLRN